MYGKKWSGAAASDFDLYVILFALLASGIIIFMRGFFLTRINIESISLLSDETGRYECLKQIEYGRDDISESVVSEVVSFDARSGRSSAISVNAVEFQDGKNKFRDSIDPLCKNGVLRKQSSVSPYDKVVVLVIDAWRIDYAGWNFTFSDKSSDFHPAFMNNAHNHMPLLGKTLEESPFFSRLYRFSADAPTVTMQRLKGLTTGSLPTFLDISSSFDSTAIMEDNWVRQVDASGRKIVFAGDDTWLKLFPQILTVEDDEKENIDLSVGTRQRFSRHKSFPYPSFDVKDLHTVDNGVIAQFMLYINSYLGNSTYEEKSKLQKKHVVNPSVTFKEFVEVMEKDVSATISMLQRHSQISDSVSAPQNEVRFFPIDDWDVLIGHTLGIDHVGHRTGADTTQMTEKLHQTDRYLRSIHESLEDRASVTGERILFVALGDHGMTKSGNHGGASTEEVSATLYLHSYNRQLFTSNNDLSGSQDSIPSSGDLSSKSKEELQDIARKHSFEGPNKQNPVSPTVVYEMNQIDFVPLISASLNLPIPFSNIGSLPAELFQLRDSLSPLTMSIIHKNLVGILNDDSNAGLNVGTEEVSFSSSDRTLRSLWNAISKLEGDLALLRLRVLNLFQVRRYIEAIFFSSTSLDTIPVTHSTVSNESDSVGGPISLSAVIQGFNRLKEEHRKLISRLFVQVLRLAPSESFLQSWSSTSTPVVESLTLDRVRRLVVIRRELMSFMEEYSSGEVDGDDFKLDTLLWEFFQKSRNVYVKSAALTYSGGTADLTGVSVDMLDDLMAWLDVAQTDLFRVIAQKEMKEIPKDAVNSSDFETLLRELHMGFLHGNVESSSLSLSLKSKSPRIPSRDRFHHHISGDIDSWIRSVDTLHLDIMPSIEMKAIDVLKETAARCRELWNTFDLSAMTCGLLLMLAVVVMSLYSIVKFYGMSPKEYREVVGMVSIPHYLGIYILTLLFLHIVISCVSVRLGASTFYLVLSSVFESINYVSSLILRCITYGPDRKFDRGIFGTLLSISHNLTLTLVSYVASISRSVSSRLISMASNNIVTLGKKYATTDTLLPVILLTVPSYQLIRPLGSPNVVSALAAVVSIVYYVRGLFHQSQSLEDPIHIAMSSNESNALDSVSSPTHEEEAHLSSSSRQDYDLLSTVDMEAIQAMMLRARESASRSDISDTEAGDTYIPDDQDIPDLVNDSNAGVAGSSRQIEGVLSLKSSLQGTIRQRRLSHSTNLPHHAHGESEEAPSASEDVPPRGGISHYSQLLSEQSQGGGGNSAPLPSNRFPDRRRDHQAGGSGARKMNRLEGSSPSNSLLGGKNGMKNIPVYLRQTLRQLKAAGHSLSAYSFLQHLLRTGVPFLTVVLYFWGELSSSMLIAEARRIGFLLASLLLSLALAPLVHGVILQRRPGSNSQASEAGESSSGVRRRLRFGALLFLFSWIISVLITGSEGVSVLFHRATAGWMHRPLPWLSLASIPETEAPDLAFEPGSFSPLLFPLETPTPARAFLLPFEVLLLFLFPPLCFAALLLCRKFVARGQRHRHPAGRVAHAQTPKTPFLFIGAPRLVVFCASFVGSLATALFFLHNTMEDSSIASGVLTPFFILLRWLRSHTLAGVQDESPGHTSSAIPLYFLEMSLFLPRVTLFCSFISYATLWSPLLFRRLSQKISSSNQRQNGASDAQREGTSAEEAHTQTGQSSHDASNSARLSHSFQQQRPSAHIDNDEHVEDTEEGGSAAAVRSRLRARVRGLLELVEHSYFPLTLSSFPSLCLLHGPHSVHILAVLALLPPLVSLFLLLALQDRRRAIFLASLTAWGKPPSQFDKRHKGEPSRDGQPSRLWRGALKVWRLMEVLVGALLASFVLFLLLLHSLRASGHAPSLASIRFESSTLGTSSPSILLSALLVMLQHCGASMGLFLLLGGPLFYYSVEQSNNVGQRRGSHNPLRLGVLSLFGVLLFIDSLFCFITRRELMVWSIFAPKLLFASFEALTACSLLLIFYAFDFAFKGKGARGIISDQRKDQ